MDCSFPKCPNKASIRSNSGLCSGHLTQKYRGKELTPLRSMESVRTKSDLRRVFRKYTTRMVAPSIEECGYDMSELGPCRIWQRSVDKDGYGQQSWKGKRRSAHKLAFWLKYGIWAKQLNHYCGRGELGCVAPRHMYEGNQQDNALDSQRLGRRAKKLTAGAVRKIRRMYRTGRYTMTELGDMFGVTRGMVSLIVKRNSWQHI